jgi:hypothetical protein
MAFVATDDSVEPSGPFLRASLFAVDRAKPELPVSGGASLLAVSSGFATSEALARVALAANDAGIPLAGVVVINPATDDSTTGSLPEAGEIRPTVRRTSRSANTEAVSRQPR